MSIIYSYKDNPLYFLKSLDILVCFIYIIMGFLFFLKCLFHIVNLKTINSIEEKCNLVPYAFTLTNFGSLMCKFCF